MFLALGLFSAVVIDCGVPRLKCFQICLAKGSDLVQRRSGQALAVWQVLWQKKQAVPVEEIAAMRRSIFMESPGSEGIKEERSW